MQGSQRQGDLANDPRVTAHRAQDPRTAASGPAGQQDASYAAGVVQQPAPSSCAPAARHPFTEISPAAPGQDNHTPPSTGAAAGGGASAFPGSSRQAFEASFGAPSGYGPGGPVDVGGAYGVHGSSATRAGGCATMGPYADPNTSFWQVRAHSTVSGLKHRCHLIRSRCYVSVLIPCQGLSACVWWVAAGVGI